LSREIKAETRRRPPRAKIGSGEIIYLTFPNRNGGIVLDVSAEGLGFQAVEPLHVYESLSFRLSVPGFPDINLSGQIAWLDDARKRGGLRVIVPPAARQEFHLWQRQYLESQPGIEPFASTELPVSQYGPPNCEEDFLANGTETVSRMGQVPRPPEHKAAAAPPGGYAPPSQPAPQELRSSRNILVVCLILTLCTVLLGGSYVLAGRREIGDLITRLGQSISGAKPPASGPAYTADTDPPAGVSSSRASHPINYQAELSAPKLSQSSAGGQQFGENAAAATASASAPAATAQSAVYAVRATRATRGPRRKLGAALDRNKGIRKVSRLRVVAKASESLNDNSLAAVPATLSETTSAAETSAAHVAAATETLAPDSKELLDPCELVSSVPPVYPKKAKKRHVEGDVKLRLVVGTNGSVTNVASLGGPPSLVNAAVDAARQFRYKPALLNGHPIETIQTIDISFKLAR